MKLDHRLFEAFPIVSPDKFEMGMHGMRVPGGYVFWWCPAGGAYLQQFVPMDVIESDPLCGNAAARSTRPARLLPVSPFNAIADRLRAQARVGAGTAEAPSDTE